MAAKKDKLYRLKKQVERNAKLNAREVERRDRLMLSNEALNRLLLFKINTESKIIEHGKAKILDEMDSTHAITAGVSSKIVAVPRVFSLCKNYEESMRAIQSFSSSVFNNAGDTIVLSFHNTIEADTPALFFMRVIQLELIEKFNDLQNKIVHHRIVPKIHLVPSGNRDVNRLLTITGYLKTEHQPVTQSEGTALIPVNDMGYLQGFKAQRHYNENRKGPHSKTIVDYMDDCLMYHDYAFSPEFKNQFEGIIAEVLSNAEDHTTYPTWYITANFSQDDFNAGPNFITGEINLTILNFGNSMYEGFLETSNDNIEMFNKISNFVDDLFVRHPEMKSDFADEQIFTMAMLQDQVSRLKYTDESRGTGTMKFISSFLDIGDYNNRERGYIPNLSIFSGHTHVNCDHTCKPLVNGRIMGIALNEERDFKLPPQKKYLKTLKVKFPGTLFSVKMYLNKAHFQKKYGE